MSYDFRAAIITTDMTLANYFASLLGDSSGDSQMFTNSFDVKHDGDIIGKFVAVPLKQSGYDRLAEFNSNGPYTLLNALGIDNTSIANAKTKITVFVGDKADVETQLQQHLTQNSLTIHAVKLPSEL